MTLTLTPGAGRRIEITARDATGAPVAPEVTVLADGTALHAEARDLGLSVTLPPEARHLVVTDAHPSGWRRVDRDHVEAKRALRQPVSGGVQLRGTHDPEALAEGHGLVAFRDRLDNTAVTPQ